MDLCPWADMVYGCDPAWWKYRKGLPEFAGIKVAWAGARLEFPDILTVEIEPDKAAEFSNRINLAPAAIGSGGNSGFQALNIAVRCGSRRILLIGFDMNKQSGLHWYGRNGWRDANNPDDHNFRRWITAFDRASVDLRRLGVEVINASPNSALTCFPKKSIKEALDAWA